MRINSLAKIIIVIISILIILIIALAAAGRRVDVNTDKQVDGLDQEMQEILYLAALAPSSHNIQGWNTKVDPETGLIIIESDETRGLSVVDPENRELFISLGCYTEMLIRAFKAYGYDAVSAYDVDHHRCVVNYSRETGQKDVNAVELIKRRHTDKNAFEAGKKIEDTVVNDIIKQIGDTEFYLSGSDGYEAIKNASFEAYTKQAYDEEAAGELSKWLRLKDYVSVAE